MAIKHLFCEPQNHMMKPSARQKICGSQMCYKLAKHGYSCMHAVSPPSLQLFLTLLDGAKFVLPRFALLGRVKAAKKAGFF